MPNYEKSRSTASRMIARKGISAFLRTSGQTLIDPDKPWLGTSRDSIVEVEVKAVRLPATAVRQFGLEALGSGSDQKNFHEISASFVMFTTDQGIDYKKFKEIRIDGETSGILAIQLLRPTNVTILGVAALKQ